MTLVVRKVDSANDRIGTVIGGRYRVEKVIGQGGFGAVYQAVHTATADRVAIKVLRADVQQAADVSTRFRHEAKATSRLKHPNTVRVFDFGQIDDGNLYLAMEFLEGKTLSDMLRQQSPVAPKRLVHIATQVLKSLSEAHSKGLVHRDLKPDNIFLQTVHGEADFVKVLDFGIAKSMVGDQTTDVTSTGAIIGTPRYMSPEQARGKGIDTRTDLYSLGIILFEALTGSEPFPADSPLSMLLRRVAEDPPNVAVGLAIATPRGVCQAVYRAMATDPSDRFDTADEMAAALQEGLASENMPPTGLFAGASRTPPLKVITDGGDAIDATYMAEQAIDTTSTGQALGTGKRPSVGGGAAAIPAQTGKGAAVTGQAKAVPGQGPALQNFPTAPQGPAVFGDAAPANAAVDDAAWRSPRAQGSEAPTRQQAGGAVGGARATAAQDFQAPPSVPPPTPPPSPVAAKSPPWLALAIVAGVVVVGLTALFVLKPAAPTVAANAAAAAPSAPAPAPIAAVAIAPSAPAPAPTAAVAIAPAAAPLQAPAAVAQAPAPAAAVVAPALAPAAAPPAVAPTPAATAPTAPAQGAIAPAAPAAEPLAQAAAAPAAAKGKAQVGKKPTEKPHTDKPAATEEKPVVKPVPEKPKEPTKPAKRELMLE